MYKFLFYSNFIICLYMFRALCAHHQEVKIVLYSICYRHTETNEWSKILEKFVFYNKFIICLYMFRPLCAYHQEVKIVLYSIWYCHAETSEWSKILDHSHVSA